MSRAPDNVEFGSAGDGVALPVACIAAPEVDLLPLVALEVEPVAESATIEGSNVKTAEVEVPLVPVTAEVAVAAGS